MSSVLGFEQHLPQSACWTVLCQGAPPFNMTEAADHLTALANGTLPQHPPLPVGRTASVTVFWSLIWEEFDSHLCRMLPSPGPAVGPGQSVPRHRGQNLEPAAWHIQFKSLSSKNYLRSIVHATYLVSEKANYSHVEAPNRLDLHTERVSKRTLDAYKVKRKTVHIFRAAARLWAAGVAFDRALEIATAAFDAAVEGWFWQSSTRYWSGFSPFAFSLSRALDLIFPRPLLLSDSSLFPPFFALPRLFAPPPRLFCPLSSLLLLSTASWQSDKPSSGLVGLNGSTRTHCHEPSESALLAGSVQYCWLYAP